MKRLLHYLNRITDQNTKTYRYTVKVDGREVQKEIYDGECSVVFLKPNGERDRERAEIRRMPTFWENDIAYTFERTHKLALDRPTVIISIPTEKLHIPDENAYTPAAADFCLRTIFPYFEKINAEYANKRLSDDVTGKYYLYEPECEVLIRNSAYFEMFDVKDYRNGNGSVIYVCEYNEPLPKHMFLRVRIEIQLPHKKLDRAKKMLTRHLTEAVEGFVREFDNAGFNAALDLERKQNSIRKFIREGDYCAFIADGSILAREKGTKKPMTDALPFKSPPEDAIEINLENSAIRGMGIRRGVTVITGGGYSGKSTLLNAISAGIYNHIAGDGRELCITDEKTVTITAEDGRAVSCLNISPFIKWIPGSDPVNFSTTHASGSTSQAANIMEAVGCGAKLLLIDEDRSATNFMIRDVIMRSLIKEEPITPFTDRVCELAGNGVSTVLVIGGSGEYLSVADKIYMMDEFEISNVTVKSKELALAVQHAEQTELSVRIAPHVEWTVERILHNENFTSYPENSGTEKMKIKV